MGNDYDKRHKQRSVTLNYVKLKFLKIRFYVSEYISIMIYMIYQQLLELFFSFKIYSTIIKNIEFFHTWSESNVISPIFCLKDSLSSFVGDPTDCSIGISLIQPFKSRTH